jgi:Na+/H+-dicarboxylate symporter
VRKDRLLFWAIAAGAVAGLLAGIAVGPPLRVLKPLGGLFLTALRMLIVPLVMSSLIVGMASLGDVRKAGRFGVLTLAYYLATTGMAVLLGMILVTALRPGEGLEPGSMAVPEMVAGKEAPTVWSILSSFLSDNLVGSMARMEILPIIVFSLCFGGVLTTLGERGARALEFFGTVNDGVMLLVRGVLWFAPVGVFALLASRLGEAGGGPGAWREVERIGAYAGTVLLGLAIHGALVLPLILRFLGRREVRGFTRAMSPALLTAFSTASSSATLPVTLWSATERAGISRRSANFVLPLGATVNMDGTALYEAVAAIFIAQAVGRPLGPGEMTLLFLTATLASIGAAGIPHAGVVTMVMVLEAVGLPKEGIGLIFSIDWLLDRFRTTANVWGDCVGAAVLDRLSTGRKGEGEI